MSSSKWILGFASSPRPQWGGNWQDTFIGGQHVLPDALNLSIPLCPLCNGERVLVLQAFAPHNAHPEREIYLFACNSIRCSYDAKAWFATRLCRDVSLNEDGESGKLKDERCAVEDPAGGDCREDINWDTDSESSASTASDLVADLAALSLQVEEAKDKATSVAGTEAEQKGSTSHSRGEIEASPGEHSTDHADPDQRDPKIHSLPCLQSYYVEVIEEPAQAKPPVSEDEVDHLLRKYKEEENALAASGVAETWGAEKEEESLASKAFDTFQDRVSRAPEQILRYGFNCEPIWPKYPSPSSETKLVCKCGSSLVFEVQVLGSCLHYLQPDKSVAPHRNEAGINFAAVAIYTCEQDCTSSEILTHSPSFKMFRQAVVVQQDEW